MSMLQYNMIHSLTLLTLHENIDLDLNLDNCGYSQEEETHQVNLARSPGYCGRGHHPAPTITWPPMGPSSTAVPCRHSPLNHDKVWEVQVWDLSSGPGLLRLWRSPGLCSWWWWGQWEGPRLDCGCWETICRTSHTHGQIFSENKFQMLMSQMLQ